LKNIKLQTENETIFWGLLALKENFLKSLHSTQFWYKRGGDTKSQNLKETKKKNSLLINSY